MTSFALIAGNAFHGCWVAIWIVVGGAVAIAAAIIYFRRRSRDRNSQIANPR